MRSAVIVASGSGSRFGGDKLSANLVGKKVIERTAAAFYGCADEIIVVTNDKELCASISYVKTVEGGATRAESVKKGLSAVSENCKTVAVHDGARPYVDKELILRVFEHAEKNGSAVPCVAVTDSLYRKISDRAEAVERKNIYAAQTPQAFDFALLKKAFAESKGDFTDEGSLFGSVYGKVELVNGSVCNTKVTYRGELPEYRIGEGFDVHAFCEGEALTVGGVKIPFDRKLSGHSDADVLIHAVMDALLSAANLPDIGVQFPNSDETYRGISSLILLGYVADMLKNERCEILNVSAVVICERPKIAPYSRQMAEKIARELLLPSDSVNISATTSEKLGALGRGDGMAASATVLIRKLISDQTFDGNFTQSEM